MTVSVKSPVWGTEGAAGIREVSSDAASIEPSAVQLTFSVPYSVPSALFSVEHPAASRAADAIKYMSCLFMVFRSFNGECCRSCRLRTALPVRQPHLPL